MTIGTPMLKLDRGNHYEVKGKKRTKGNLQAVVHEADEERRCSDPDLDRKMTPYNKVTVGALSAYDDGHIGQAYLDEIKRLEGLYKEQRGYAPKSNSVLGVAMIVKPSGEDWDGLEADEQDTVLSVISEQINKHITQEFPDISEGFSVTHHDEANAHEHKFYLDPTFHLSRMCGLPFKGWLNREMPLEVQAILDAKYPDISRKINIMPNADHRQESPEEREERRKHVGLDSKEYKAKRSMQAQRDYLKGLRETAKAQRQELRDKSAELLTVKAELKQATAWKRDAITAAQEAETQTEDARRTLCEYEMRTGTARREAQQAEEQARRAQEQVSRAERQAQQAEERARQAQEQERQAQERITQAERRLKRLEAQAQELGIAVNTELQVRQNDADISVLTTTPAGMPTVKYS